MKTVTLEQAKKLIRLGVGTVKTHFVWDKPPGNKDWAVIERWMVEDDSEVMIAAPTAEEMLDRMPDRLIKDGLEFELITQKGSDNVYFPNYYNFSIEQNLWDNPAKHSTLSEAVGDLFIWLAVNKHLEKKCTLSGN